MAILEYLKSAFLRKFARKSIPHQSKGRNVRFPGSTLAAKELGVSRSHLHRVLTGERKSPELLARWQAWLKRHPDFARLQQASASTH